MSAEDQERNRKRDDEVFDPGFIDEDEPPQPVPRPASDTGRDDDFDPFANAGPIDTGGVSGVATGNAGDDDDVGHMAPPAPGPIAAADPQAAEAEMDAEIAPGSRRDLWMCPHCGAKSRPERDTCRSCGKHPDDPVGKALGKRVPMLVGIAAVLILGVILVLMMRTDTSYQPPGRDSIDTALRAGGERIAASGRVLSTHSSRYADRSVMLVFGPAATDDAAFGELRSEVGSQVLVKRGRKLADDVSYALVHPQGLDADLEYGDFFSFVGSRVPDTPALKRHEFVVAVERHEVAREP